MRIAFCGIGALGSTAVVLCRNLDATLRLIDFDRVESKNLMAQAFVKQSLGKNKAQAMKLQLTNFYGKKAEAYGVRLAAQNLSELLGDSDVLVDCFDNFDSRTLLSDYARGEGKPLVHAAISGDGTFGLVRWDERFRPDREDSEGQTTCEGGEHLPLIGLLAATLARTLQDFLATEQKHDSIVRLSGAERT